MKVVGYGDRLSVEPGGSIAFMVSSQEPRYRARVVRLLHGDDSPDGPGFKSEPVDSALAGEHDGKVQPVRRGSYVRVPADGRLALRGSFTIQLWLQPTTPGKERQALLTGPGYALRLVDGRLELESGGSRVRVETPAAPFTWYFASAVLDAEAGEARLSLEPLKPSALGLAAAASGPAAAPAGGAGDLLLAADEQGSHYNGKLDAPRLFARALGADELARLRAGEPPRDAVAAWDFSADITTRRVSDVSGNDLHGRTVNMPMRAATGHDWDGRETAWRHAPAQYGAIHFHDDDLDDCGWEVDLEWTVPDDLRSGVYAVHLEAGGEEDYVPFFVRPRRGRPTAKIAFLAPTFSYLAYANEHLMASPEARVMMDRMGIRVQADYPSTPQDRYIVANELLSLYDSHADGSGVCYSSRLRPILNLRPKYETPILDDGKGSPHQFNADLCLVDWLTELGYEFDVVTDEDLHAEGLELLRPYNVILTGSHCEYWSQEMMDAALAYLNGGGRVMYLAGNGMYWVTQLDPEERHTVEIRRRGPSSRAWEPQPGEAHLSTTGELGGLWRYRGRSPQSWLGVGFTAQGMGEGRPYERRAGSFDPRAAFIFAGIGDDEPIGDFPSLVNSYGAAGFEVDRVDPALGTPHHTLLLAQATGFSDLYQHVSEEIMFSDSKQGGTVNELVRADMVFLEYPNGGAVFSPASIQWSGSLSWNGYDNTVSRVTRNVLDRFAADGPLPAPVGAAVADEQA